MSDFKVQLPASVISAFSSTDGVKGDLSIPTLSTSFINILKNGFAAGMGIPVTQVAYTGITHTLRRLNELAEKTVDHSIVHDSGFVSAKALDIIASTLDGLLGKNAVLGIEHTRSRDQELSSKSWNRLMQGDGSVGGEVPLAEEKASEVKQLLGGSMRALQQSGFTVGITTITIKVGTFLTSASKILHSN